jgi:AAHS family 4-hydroxybenzoate transporter-like MFS transporter
MEDSAVDVGAFIDRRPVGRFQITVLLLCAAIMFADGYNVFVMGFLVPILAKTFHVAPAALTFVFLMQAAGLTLGAYIAGPIADRVGRRRVLITSALLFGVATLACVLAKSVAQLGLLRFVGGLFFSAAIPNAIALTSEFSPNRVRGTLVNLMFVGYVAGIASGGAIVTLLVRTHGWESAFWFGGLVPLATAALSWALLPESIRYRVSRDPCDPRIPALLKKIDPNLALDGSERFVLSEPLATGVAVAALFHDGRAAQTLLLWLGYFTNLLVITILGAFFVTFLRIFSGMSLARAAGITSFYSIAGIVAMIFYGWFIDRFGAPRLLAVTYFIAAVALTVLGLMNLTSPWVYFVVFWVGACVVGGQGGLNALGAILYPTRVRATGLAWAFGLGAVGRFVGPALGGMVLHRHWSALQAFLVPAAIPILIASLGMLAMTCVGAQDLDKELASAAARH